MNHKGQLKRFISIVLATLLFQILGARADVTLTTLVTFDGTNGYLPQDGLLLGRDGNLYGTLSYGGWFDLGTVFRVGQDGKCVIIATFDGQNGSHPSSLIMGNDGNFYGTTLEGGTASGDGTVFKMTPDGTIKTLASFGDYVAGYSPQGLIQGQDGSFYGGVRQLGTKSGAFKLTPTGQLILPYTNAIPTNSAENLLKTRDGNSYGTTFADRGDGSSAFGWGTVFRVSPNGVRTTLLAFSGTNGGNPTGRLVQGNDGDLYGVTTSGGAFKQGTVFRINLTGSHNPMPIVPVGVNIPIAIHPVSNRVDPRILDAMQRPIEFYGKVVDENNNPVAGVDINFEWMDLLARGMQNSARSKSDSNGLFSLHGKQGSSMTVSVGIEGYYASNWGRVSLRYSKMGPDRYVPDSNNPVLFHLRKKGPGVQLLTSNVGIRPNLAVRIPKTNAPVRVDLLLKKMNPSGQLEISQSKPPWKDATEWSFRMNIPDGGFVENHDEFQFQAPDGGYRSSVGYHFVKGTTNWVTQVSKQFYIAFGQPRQYGWLRVESNLDQETVFLTYAINPDGSRNLEPAH